MNEKYAPPAAASPPRTVALIGKYNSREILESLALLAKDLRRRGVVVLVEETTAEIPEAAEAVDGFEACGFAEIGARADVAIVLGGDGTMLNAARRLAQFQVPLVGINQGRLGFMTDIALRDMLTGMDELFAGRFTAEHRMLLLGEVLRGQHGVASSLALNEIVVEKGAIGRLIEFALYIDDEFVYSLRSDGLIASTSTGSTAYALSANGPILHPDVAGIALVPLCPHSLTNRPVLVGDRRVIEIRIVRATDSRVYFDGQVTLDLKPDDRVRIRRAESTICFLHPPGYSYFSMLRQKLHWGEPPKAV